jgi:hypothetical protein
LSGYEPGRSAYPEGVKVPRKGEVVGRNNLDGDGRESARNVGVDGRIILKWILT